MLTAELHGEWDRTGRLLWARLGTCDRERPGQAERLGGRFRRVVYLQVGASAAESNIEIFIAWESIRCVIGTFVEDPDRSRDITSRTDWMMAVEGGFRRGSPEMYQSSNSS